MRFVGNAEIDRRQKAKEAAEERQSSLAISSLSSHITQRWNAARQAKERITVHLLRCLRQRKGVYDPETLQAIREAGGSAIYMMLTNVKCRAAAAWLRDIMVPADDRAWSLDPSPIAELPPQREREIQERAINDMLAMFDQSGYYPSAAEARAHADQVRELVRKEIEGEARRSGERMSRKLDDQLLEGEWDDSVLEFIDDLVTYPAAIIKGPVVRKRKRLQWGSFDIGGNQSSHPIVAEKLVKEWDRRSPFDSYPSPGARTIQDGYYFDRHALSISGLQRLKGVEGFDSDAIDEIVYEYGTGGLREWLTHDHERSTLEGRPNEYLQGAERIDALNYWGDAPGFQLRQWDPEGKVIGEDIDPAAVYQIEAWKIGRWLIKAVLNPDPLGLRPYSKASYVNVPGSFWGQGIPELIRDDQDMANAAARACSDNMGIASGPQVAIHDTSRLPDGEDVTEIYPWKIWQFGPDDQAAANRQPIEFYQPTSNANELLGIFEHFSRSADDHAALPAYIYGGEDRVGGAGSTASGLSMLMGQASKNMKLVISNIDKAIRERIQALFVWNMLFDPDPSIKGDLVVRALGSSSLLVREQRQLRLNELLALTNNDIDLQIMGVAGRATLLREVAKDMIDIPIDDLIPNLAEQARSGGGPMGGNNPGMLSAPGGEGGQPGAEGEQPNPDDVRAMRDRERISLDQSKAEATLVAGKRDHERRMKEIENKLHVEIETIKARKEADIEKAKRDDQRARETSDRDAQAAFTADNQSLLGELDQVAITGEVETRQERETREAETEQAAAKRHQALETQLSTLSGALEAVLSRVDEGQNRTLATQEQVGQVAKGLELLLEERRISNHDREIIIGRLRESGSPETQATIAELDGA